MAAKCLFYHHIIDHFSCFSLCLWRDGMKESEKKIKFMPCVTMHHVDLNLLQLLWFFHHRNSVFWGLLVKVINLSSMKVPISSNKSLSVTSRAHNQARFVINERCTNGDFMAQLENWVFKYAIINWSRNCNFPFMHASRS